MAESPVCRLGDYCTGHPPCWEPRPNIQGSPDVFANAIPIHRLGDAWAVHGTFPCLPHGGVLASASQTVFANALGIGRIGDAVNCGSFVAQGSPDVFAGD